MMGGLMHSRVVHYEVLMETVAMLDREGFHLDVGDSQDNACTEVAYSGVDSEVVLA